MTKDDHLLVILSEEAHEVSMAAGRIGQAASKALRFGMDDGYPGTERTNRGDLVGEFNDLVALFEMLQEAGINLPGLYDREAIEAKKAKVTRFLEHSRNLGRLSSPEEPAPCPATH